MKQEARFGVRTLLSPSDFSGRAAGSPKLVLIQAIAAGRSTNHRAQASAPALTSTRSVPCLSANEPGNDVA
jgi:hypothetical protein